jgi:hypothetical protein
MIFDDVSVKEICEGTPPYEYFWWITVSRFRIYDIFSLSLLAFLFKENESIG